MADLDTAYVCNYSRKRTVRSRQYKVEVITNRLSSDLSVFDIQEIVNSLEEAKQYFKEQISWYENDEDVIEYMCPYRREIVSVRLSDLSHDEYFTPKLKLYKFKCSICGEYHHITEDAFEYCKTLVTKKEDLRNETISTSDQFY